MGIISFKKAGKQDAFAGRVQIGPQGPLRDILVTAPVIKIDNPLPGKIHGNARKNQVFVDLLLRRGRRWLFQHQVEMFRSLLH
jgi:hypothetical protein